MPASEQKKTKSDKQQEHDHNFEHEVVTYLEWHAPGRPFKERTFEFFANAFLIMMAIEIILFLFSEYFLMLVVFALVFLSFALALVPPKNFYYTISSEGIRVEDHFFIWDELYDFYILKRHNRETVHVTTASFYPGELVLTIPKDMDTDLVKKILLPHLPFREYVKLTFVEKAGDWLEKNFPLEKSIS